MGRDVQGHSTAGQRHPVAVPECGTLPALLYNAAVLIGNYCAFYAKQVFAFSTTNEQKKKTINNVCKSVNSYSLMGNIRQEDKT